ncbi:MAG: hypothetical protein OEY01_16430 [Desulfobulbaceae bacterium]|nr:hypothetical protein [Desulfobulbaceae bacterium]
MRLVCPGCGCTASLEAWANDADCRATLAAIVKLPAPVPAAVLPYLSLFRPEARALNWKKVLKLVNELALLVGSGHVQVDKMVARPCPARIWAQAMDDMVASFNTKRPHFKNHTYLRKVAYDLANQGDAEKERQTISEERNPYIRQSTGPTKIGQILPDLEGDSKGRCSQKVAMENLRKIRDMIGGGDNAE